VEDGVKTGIPLTASAKLAGGLRPSTPPQQPRRSRFRRGSPANWSEEAVWQLPNSSDAGHGWPGSPSSASNATGLSGASTAAGPSPEKPPKVEITPPRLEVQEPRRAHGSVSFRQAVSYVSLPSADAETLRKQTASSDFSEASWKPQATPEDGDEWEDMAARRRSSLASASTSATAPKARHSSRASIMGIKGEFDRRGSQRRSVAPVDLLDTTLLRGRAESQSYDVDGEVDAVDLEPVSEPPTQTEDADEVASLNSSEEADVQSPKASALRPPSGLATRATQRRFGVTAQSSSGWNVSWTAPEESKTAEQSAALRAALRQCPFMKKIDDDTLESLVRAMPVQTFDPGAIVCRQGARDDCAYVIVEGSVNVFQEPDPETDPDGAQVFVRPLTRGRLFGEFSMLWSTPRTRSVYVDQQQAVLGVLTQEVFRNLVVRNEMKERSRREACLRRSAMLETLDDEEIAQLADALQKKCFEEGEVIVRQGDTGNELYVVLEGTCVVTVETGSKDRDRDIQECKRCYAGDMFGEKALLEKTKRCATVSAATKVEVLALRRDTFERMLGPLSQLQKIHYLCDPRRSIADFYLPGDQSGPAGVCKERRTGEEPDATTWFAVYRPTSRDAIAKMLSGAAVGKGLNVKGKSAKMPNRLSGFVPFLQISQESHKSEIETSPADARVCIYFASEMLRQSAMVQLQALLETSSPIEEPEIRLLDHYESVPGLDVPEAVVQQAFILKPDIQPAVGWETGRVSEPAFMDMNLQALRGTSRPKVVLYQFDQDNPMNPHGLLIAYAENTVKPVVSDFDTFLVGSRGMDYEHLPPEQAELCLWALDHTEKILRSPSTSSWTSRWLEVLKEAHEKGFHPHIPEFGFGDATSYRLIEEVIHTTKESGAIRHGAECFNFYFPQELDTNFLVVWEGFHDIDGKPWAYMDEDELRDFLTERVEENYALPLNPIWCVRDLGWFDILEHQIENQSCKAALEAWYPEQSGILEKIKALHEEFTEGLELKASADNARPLLRTLSHCPDLDMSEKAMLAISQASSAGSRWTTARLKVNVLQQIKRSSMAVHHLLGK